VISICCTEWAGAKVEFSGRRCRKLCQYGDLEKKSLIVVEVSITWTVQASSVSVCHRKIIILTGGQGVGFPESQSLAVTPSVEASNRNRGETY
jgi:hypothetical protein